MQQLQNNKINTSDHASPLSNLDEIKSGFICSVYDEEYAKLKLGINFIHENREFVRYCCGYLEHKNINDDSKLGGKTLILKFDEDTIFDRDVNTGIYNKKFCGVDCLDHVETRLKLKEGFISYREIKILIGGLVKKYGHLFWEISFYDKNSNEIFIRLRD